MRYWLAVLGMVVAGCGEDWRYSGNTFENIHVEQQDLCQRVEEIDSGWLLYNEYVPCDQTIPRPQGPCWDADGSGDCIANVTIEPADLWCPGDPRCPTPTAAAAP